MTGAWWQYLGVFLSSTCLCGVLTPLMIRVALRKNILDRPGAHKSHELPVPYLGGVAILIAFMVPVGMFSLLDRATRGDAELMKFLGLAALLGLLGLLDDLVGLSATLRLIVEMAVAISVWQWELGVSFLPHDGLDLIATVFWIVGLVNAFNMVDNMDGLSSGLAAISAASLASIAMANGQFLAGGLGCALTGCALGFLRQNVFPAKIYMGDAGAYFIGFMVAVLGLKLQFAENPQNNLFLVPVVACSVPIADALFVSVTRLRRGASPFVGGRDHMSHRLTASGLSVPVAVGSIHLVAASAGIVAFVIARVDDSSGWVLASLVGVLLVVFATILARAEVSDEKDHSSVTTGTHEGRVDFS